MTGYHFKNDDFTYCEEHAQALIDLGKEPIEIKEYPWDECDICWLEFSDNGFKED